ncbi:MAG: hypothetical protein U0350_43850 [Caldilineaceae bacterium]
MDILIVLSGFLLTGMSLMLLSFFVRATLHNRARVPNLTVAERRSQRNTSELILFIFLALVYNELLRLLPTLTGIPILDGSIGVALGLYICAHPAANAVNLLFFETDLLHQISEWSVVRWIILNLLVLLAGWMVIFNGIIRWMANRG